MFGVPQWCCLCVLRMLFLADVGVAQDAQPLSVGGHEAVLDTVVDHLDKMASAVWNAMQVPLFGGTVNPLAARRAQYVTRSLRQRRKGWIEVRNHVLFATNHHAVTAFQTPHPTARPDVHVVDP